MDLWPTIVQNGSTPKRRKSKLQSSFVYQQPKLFVIFSRHKILEKESPLALSITRAKNLTRFALVFEEKCIILFLVSPWLGSPFWTPPCRGEDIFRARILSAHRNFGPKRFYKYIQIFTRNAVPMIGISCEIWLQLFWCSVYFLFKTDLLGNVCRYLEAECLRHSLEVLLTDLTWFKRPLIKIPFNLSQPLLELVDFCLSIVMPLMVTSQAVNRYSLP